MREVTTGLEQPDRISTNATRSALILGIVLFAATFMAYQPAWHGGLLWDDDAHITKPALQSMAGLQRIWFEIGATQQYYPLVHSVFWVQSHLWGGSTFGYHLSSIFLHSLSALLFALILLKLRVPGALLAAAIFALHPVHVESVAWISELKNTLSGALYLGAVLAYLYFDESLRRRHYALALACFALALASKSVTATLPAALLVISWWRRGRLDWRRDVSPLYPFFGLGLAFGLFTVWAEHTMIGARGADFNFTLIERCLIAGRAILFYLGKLIWPANLIFIYPRWVISQGVWWQYLFPLGVLALIIVLWFFRKHSRAPLAAMLFFCITLFPALGFFNVYPFLYSFVADHFQYLASLGIITLLSSGVAQLLSRWKMWPGPTAIGVGLILAGVLGILSWRQSRQYAAVETLYRETLARNPSCWLADYNMGFLLSAQGQYSEALAYAKEAVRLRPDWYLGYHNLGIVLGYLGRFPEAVDSSKEAVRLKPDYAEAQANLGVALGALGLLDEAVAHCREALKLKPREPVFYNQLGVLLGRQSKNQEALLNFSEAIRLKPDFPDAHANMGVALEHLGRIQEAIEHYRAAANLEPGNQQSQNNIRNALRLSR